MTLFFLLSFLCSRFFFFFFNFLYQLSGARSVRWNWNTDKKTERFKMSFLWVCVCLCVSEVKSEAYLRALFLLLIPLCGRWGWNRNSCIFLCLAGNMSRWSFHVNCLIQTVQRTGREHLQKQIKIFSVFNEIIILNILVLIDITVETVFLIIWLMKCSLHFTKITNISRVTFNAIFFYHESIWININNLVWLN